MNVTQSVPRIGVHVFDYDGTEFQVHDDIIGISTHKDMESAAGTWSLMLTARRDSFGRTWAKRIRPTSYIELHGSRTALPGSQNSLTGDPSGQTVIMRGFVDNCSENVSVTENGQVQRIIVIAGSDYGKVLIKRQLVYAPEINPLAMSQELQGYLITKRLRMPDANYFTPVSEFLGRIKEILVIDPTIGALQPSDRVPKLQARTDIPDTDKVALLNLTPRTGSIWNFLQSYAGQPWNEQFLRDDDDAPRLYWRRAPLHNKLGKIEWPNAMDEFVAVALSDVISENVSVNDNGPDRTGAYCAWLTLPSFMSSFDDPLKGEALYLTTTDKFFADLTIEGALDPFRVGYPQQLGGAPTGTVAFAASGNPILRTDIFKRYGFAFHQALYPLYPFPDTTNVEQGKIAARYTQWLHRTESWSPCMESGQIVIKGNAHIRVGTYLRLENDDKTYQREFYVRAVDQHFTIFPAPSWTTSITVDRGLWLSTNPYQDLTWL